MSQMMWGESGVDWNGLWSDSEERKNLILFYCTHTEWMKFIFDDVIISRGQQDDEKIFFYSSDFFLKEFFRRRKI